MFPLLWTEPTCPDSPPIMQGLSIPFACIGSGDPVRVLCLYTTNTLDIFWSIYYWGICTTCCYRFYCVVLKPYALRLATATATAGQLTSVCVCVWHWVWRRVSWVSHTVLCGALYTACVDTSRTVFWDRSQFRWKLMMVGQLSMNSQARKKTKQRNIR